MNKAKAAVEAFAGVWFFLSLIILREELGLLHRFGFNPITTDALHDPLLFGDIFAGGIAFSAWWFVHWYRRKYGDLSK